MAADVPHSAFESYVGESVPQASPGSPGKDGRLELAFVREDADTRLVRDFARAPFHVSGTLATDPVAEAATVLIQSPSGGMAQGDRRRIEILVGPEGVAHVGTGSATKVYSMRHNYAASSVDLAVASGGHLEYLPEPTILHADARLHRTTSLSVEDDTTAILGEVLVPGRLARGEVCDFERYCAETRIEGGDRLLAADAVHLAPDERSVRIPGVLGEGAVVGTCFVVAPGTDSAALGDALHRHVTAGTPDGATAGATRLPNGAGVLVRIVGERAEPVRTGLTAAWRGARHRLLDAPIPERRA